MGHSLYTPDQPLLTSEHPIALPKVVPAILDSHSLQAIVQAPIAHFLTHDGLCITKAFLWPTFEVPLIHFLQVANTQNHESYQYLRCAAHDILCFLWLFGRSVLTTPCVGKGDEALLTNLRACHPHFWSQSEAYRIGAGVMMSECPVGGTSLHCSNRLCVLCSSMASIVSTMLDIQ